MTTATCEAEYVALCDAAKEAIFERAVSVFLQPQLAGMCVDIFGDNGCDGNREQPKQCVEE